MAGKEKVAKAVAKRAGGVLARNPWLATLGRGLGIGGSALGWLALLAQIPFIYSELKGFLGGGDTGKGEGAKNAMTPPEAQLEVEKRQKAAITHLAAVERMRRAAQLPGVPASTQLALTQLFQGDVGSSTGTADLMRSDFLPNYEDRPTEQEASLAKVAAQLSPKYKEGMPGTLAQRLLSHVPELPPVPYDVNRNLLGGYV